MKSLGRVLMLDDDKIFLEMYSNILKARGYEVFATSNAYQYLLYARELQPDVMFLDINMPELNGWEVLQRLSIDDKLREIPIVMVTVSQDEALAVAKGASHFLKKPMDIEELMEIVETYCQGKKDHDILLLEEYEPLFVTLLQMLEKQQHSYFGLHSLGAAVKYLRKNNPKIVCVHAGDEKFARAKKTLKHDKVFQVADVETITKLAEEVK